MTIYYVNPVTGSNANTGLSWAQAWLWPPGNGAAVGPGDEIRFAKSTERTPAGSYRTSSAGTLSLTNSTPGYQNASLGQAWTKGALAGTVSAAGVYTIPTGTAIPANTRLMYRAHTRTQSTLNGLELMVQYSNLIESASGAGLKVCICSDAAGNTPILTLDGPTWFSLTNQSVTSFLYNSATTLSFTMGSIAVYSIAAFTVTGGSATITPHDQLLVTPDQSAASTAFLRRGEAFNVNTSFPLSVGNFLPAARRDIYMYPNTMAALGVTPSPDPTWRHKGGGTATFDSQFTIYSAIPFRPKTTYETNLNYSGTAGSRIRIRGGFDPATDIQDGFTNLALGQLNRLQRKGWFCFSSGGGQYLDFERFISIQATLIWFDFTVTTITGIRFFDCTLGSVAVSNPTASLGVGIFGATAITSPVAVNAWYMERCTSYDFFTFIRGQSYESSALAKFWATTDFTFGSVDLVDCCIADSGAAVSRIACTGNISMRSSVAGELRALFVRTGEFRPSAAFTGTLTVSDCAITTITTFSGGGGAAATSAKAVLRNVFATDFGTINSSATCQIVVGDFRDLTIDGYGLNNTYDVTSELHVSNTSGFYANNPTGFLMVGGPVYTRRPLPGVGGTGSTTNCIRLTNPPPASDFSGAIRPFSLSTHPNATSFPGLVLADWSGTVSIAGFRGSYAHALSPTYVAGTYFPDAQQAVFLNCIARVSSSGPLGVVRQVGGEVKGVDFPEYSLFYQNIHPFSAGVRSYGVTVDSIEDGALAAAGVSHLDRRAIVVGLLGSNIKYGRISGGFPINIPLSIILDENTTFAAVASTSGGNTSANRGLLLRRPSGGWTYLRAGVEMSNSISKNAYGRRTITLPAQAGITLARLDVAAGATYNLVVRVRCLDAYDAGLFQRCTVLIPPCTAYTTDIQGHYIRRHYTSNTEDLLVAFSVSPQKSGEIYVNFFSTSLCEIKDFSASLV